MSSEGLKSLIVTDPDLVDPEIDTSGLRTQTDTNPRLLASIADFPGISYDPTSFDYLSDLNELFAYDLPMVETPEAVTPPITTTPVVDTGGGGQATLPSITDTTSEPTFIGGGATLEDAGGVPELGGVYATDYQGDPLVDQMSEVSIPTGTINPLAQEMSEVSIPVVDPLAEEMSEVSIPITDTFIGGGATLEDAGGIPELGGGMGPDYQGDPNIIAPSGDIFAQGDPLAEEKIDVVTQEDVDNPTNLLQKLGIPEDFDIKKALIDTGINLVVGAPITLIAEGLKAVLPQAEPTFTQRTLTDELGLTDYRKFAGDPTTSAFAGLNAFGQFGDPVKSAKDRIDTRLENIENKNYGPGDKFYDDTQTMIEEYNRVTNKLGDIDAITTGDAQIAEETIGTLPEITEARQKQGEYIQEIEQQKAVDTTTQRGRDEADKQKEETGVAKVETDYGTRYESSGGTFASAEEAAEKGDGPSGGGGKIVCTMMNESYGFGSFRNKIWMKFHKDLSPEYQKGYHKLFLPLVRIAKTNKIVKKILEHIAVQSTIDMRQATRGKIHLIGRVYRKILLPLCYWVGKYAK